MDINKALRELYAEKKRLDSLISTLERCSIHPEAGRRSRRGRKKMGAEERLQVSRRMTSYWAARRALQHQSSETSAVTETDSATQSGTLTHGNQVTSVSA